MAAAHPFGENIGHVVGGVDEKRLEREVDADLGARPHADLARRLARRERRDRELLVELELTRTQLGKDDIGRHQFGEGGGIPGLAGAILRDDLARLRVEEERGSGECGRTGGGHGERQEE